MECFHSHPKPSKSGRPKNAFSGDHGVNDHKCIADLLSEYLEFIIHRNNVFKTE